MPYLIVPSSFAPKCPKYTAGAVPQNVHSISYCKCNFDCEFCFFKYYQSTNQYVDFSPDEFEQLVRELLPRGSMFKFTGGEPTLNPDLPRDLEIVKKLGGTCFLDTNGSSPKIIENLLQRGLVDLYGISLKGLTEEEARKRSGVANTKLCWHNVLQNIKTISDSGRADVIVTYVCYSSFDIETLTAFSQLLLGFKNVYLKINNYQPNKEHPTPELKPKDPRALEAIIHEFTSANPFWQGRVTLINGPKAVADFNEVIIA